METQNSSSKWAGAGLLAAITASLCCITPVLALLAGTSGLASTFSWIEPARPYLLGLTVGVLGFAWFQKLKPQQVDIDCECDPVIGVDGKMAKAPFLHSKTFLGIVTVFAALMLAFPHYAQVFYPDNSKEVVIINQADLKTVTFDIKGMTCAGCEEHVKHASNELPGVVESDASFEKGNAIIKFDQSKTSLEELKAAIDATGYKVTSFQLAYK